MFFDETIRKILKDAKSIAIVGAKDKKGLAVDRVGQYLMAAGYSIYPVHPTRKNVWGLLTYTCLGELPAPVSIVNIFRAPEACRLHAQEVTKLKWKPACFWMQSGIRSLEAREILTPQQIHIIEDACIMVEHERVLGNFL